MFFLRYLTREMTMNPGLFARDMTQILKEQLYQQMEGDCNGEFYTICILDVTDISRGRVLPGTAEAMFTLSYRAIVWKPFRGETVSSFYYWTSPSNHGCDMLMVYLESLTAWSQRSIERVFSARLVP